MKAGDKIIVNKGKPNQYKAVIEQISKSLRTGFTYIKILNQAGKYIYIIQK